MMNIRTHHIDLDDRLRKMVEEKIGSVVKFYDNIIQIDVELEKTTEHHQNGKIYKAYANIEVPRKKLVRAESTQGSIEAALDIIKAELGRELKKMKEKENSRNHKDGLAHKEVRHMEENVSV